MKSETVPSNTILIRRYCSLLLADTAQQLKREVLVNSVVYGSSK